MKAILILICFSLVCCQSASDKFTGSTGITPGQSLALAGQLLDQYQGLRRANQSSGKAVVEVAPLVPVESEPLSLWQKARGLAALFGF
jgi:hypothetical protein